MLDFWLPQDCVFCHQPPVQLCQRCVKGLPLRVRQVYRLGLPPGFACADYADDIATLVKEYKNHGSVVLARHLAAPMARALAQHLGQKPSDRPVRVALVPAPSRQSANRERGYTPAKLLASNIAAELRGQGVVAAVHPVLSLARGVQDQGGLGAADRKTNLAGQMSLDLGMAQRLKDQRIVLVDDIVTTGATLAEMFRVLSEAGYQPERFLTFAEAL